MKNRIVTFMVTAAVMLMLAVSCGGQQQPNAANADGNAPPTFVTIAVENFEMHPKGKEATDGFSYKVNFVYPSDYGDKAVLEKLQQKFIRYTFGEDYVAMVKGDDPTTLEKATDAYIAVWKQAYYDEMEEMQTYDPYSDFVIGWHIECSNAILFMNETLLQLKTKNGWYPYSAHIFEGLSLHLFNLQTGDEYSRNDVFKPEAADNIRDLIIPELLKYWNIQSLDDLGMNRNEIWTPETNFAITDNGMLIAHNHDEFGVYEVTIPYKKILPCLREGTPVWDAVKSIENYELRIKN